VPLVTMKEILERAEQSGYGVGSFSVVSAEMVRGAIRAAEETNSPIILQIAEVRLKHAPLDLMGPVMVAAAEHARVPVAVHLDHGLRLDTIKQALDLGFTSVMFDGSHLPLEQNIAKTNEVIRIANTYGASVEGEIGRVGGSEDNSEDIEMLITSVKEAKEFFESTGVDAMAIAIGNVHGVYKSEPKLQFERLQEIKKIIKNPLVLHGGSGLTVVDFRNCIKYGIKKINVQTATLNKVVERVKSLLARNPEVDYFTYHDCIVDSACECVKSHIEAFQSYNQA